MEAKITTEIVFDKQSIYLLALALAAAGMLIVLAANIIKR